MPHLGVPLGPHVLEAGRVDEREADEENILGTMILILSVRAGRRLTV